MKEGRLFQILYYILEKGQVTAPELAERFEVSVRTIYRDSDKNAGGCVVDRVSVVLWHGNGGY